jgi:hypothetical protein
LIRGAFRQVILVLQKGPQNAARRCHLVDHQPVFLPVQITDQDPKVLPERVQLDRPLQQVLLSPGQFPVRDRPRGGWSLLPFHEDRRKGRLPQQVVGKGQALEKL